MSATSEASVTEEASVLQEKSQMDDSQSGMMATTAANFIFLHQWLSTPKQN